MRKLQTYLPATQDLQVCRIDNEYRMSVYSDTLTKVGIAGNVLKLKKTFPALPKEFYEILQDRLMENNFTDQKLTDSVNHVIDTFIYPNPTIANFLSYTKDVRLYTYQEIIKMLDENKKAFDYYKLVNDSKVRLYAHIRDIEKYNLKILQNNQ
jgi:hypothetical protein